MMVGSSFFILGIVALIPFVAGMLGFSRLTAYLTAVLMCGFIYLAAVTFSDALKFQSVYRLLLIGVGTTAVLTVELLFTFVLAHWFGTRCRELLIWMKARLL
jgi:uncharacterized membrane protein